MSDAIPKRSIIIDGHRTSVSLEDVFWERCKGIAQRKNLSINTLFADIEKTRQPFNLSSASRIYVLMDLDQQLRDAQENRDTRA